jgi:hypothetical protein
VRDNALLVAPQPGYDEILVVGGRRISEAVDAAADPQGASALDVEGEERAGVAGLGGLDRREVGRLGGGEGAEDGPVSGVHANRLSPVEHSCNQPPHAVANGCGTVVPTWTHIHAIYLAMAHHESQRSILCMNLDPEGVHLNENANGKTDQRRAEGSVRRPVQLAVEADEPEPGSVCDGAGGGMIGAGCSSGRQEGCGHDLLVTPTTQAPVGPPHEPRCRSLVRQALPGPPRHRCAARCRASPPARRRCPRR